MKEPVELKGKSTLSARDLVMASRSRLIGGVAGGFTPFPSIGFGTLDLFVTRGVAFRGGGTRRSQAGSAMRISATAIHSRAGLRIRFGVPSSELRIKVAPQ